MSDTVMTPERLDVLEDLLEQHGRLGIPATVDLIAFARVSLARERALTEALEAANATIAEIKGVALTALASKD